MAADAWRILACAGGWLAWSLLVGWLAQRLPPAALDHDSWLTAPGAWGELPADYERWLRIRRWKDRLPDAGAAFAGGVRKASLVGRNGTALGQLVAETRRAELVHLALWPFWLVTALWLPPGGVLLNLLFATAFNLPCLLLQRFNRLRLTALLARMGPARPSGP